MNFLLKTYYLLKHFGPGLLSQRLGLAMKDRLGLTRRVFRRQPWHTIRLSELCEAGVDTDDEGYTALKRGQSLPFFFPLGQPPKLIEHVIEAAGDRSPSLEERVALLRENRCVYFFHTPSPEKNDWHTNPFTGGSSAKDRLWSDLPFFDEALGDARVMWEPSRAAWAYDLARCAVRDGDPTHAVEFWRWVDSWMDGNQPFDGFQWKCGQESAVRLMAMLLGFWTFADEAEPKHWVQMAKLAWATGYRIEHHIDYAISQKNNHALSEACGLMLIGYLFPEFQSSPPWRRLGRRVLTDQLRMQIYDDGSYIQHSFNYHRVMLQVSLVALRVAELANEPFERDIYERLDKAKTFLHAMMDENHGRAPNYGNNDGSLVLPLNECDFTDYRPVLQAVHFLVHRERWLPAGLWDEDVYWLFGDEATEALAGECTKVERVGSTAFEEGGYFTLRKEASWAMMRCHTYRDRPGHCDQLHVDLWWQGHNVFQDAGSYLYYTPGRGDVAQYFKSTKAHNTIEIDDNEPAEFVSRFLMLPWLSGRIKHHYVNDSGLAWMEGERSDYDRKPWRVLHRRSVIGMADDVWLVVDDLFGDGDHRATLRWHLADWPWKLDAERAQVTAQSALGDISLALCAREAKVTSIDLVSGRDQPDDVQGLVAPYYGEKQAAPTWEVMYEFCEKSRMVTAVHLGGSMIELAHVDVDSILSPEGESWSVITEASRKVVKLASLDRGSPRTLLSIE